MSRGKSSGKKSFDTAVFFPSASRVQVPFVGDRKHNIKLIKQTYTPPPLIAKPQNHRRKDRVGKSYIQNIFENVDFDPEVVQERSSKSLKFDRDQLEDLYSPGDVIPDRGKPAASGGRFTSRGYIKKLPSHIKTVSVPDSGVRIPRHPTNSTVTERIDGRLPAETNGKLPIDYCEGDDAAFRGKWNQKKVPGRTSCTPKSSPREYQLVPATCPSNRDRSWDEHVIHQLSKDTARWIVFENTNQGPQKERLHSLVTNKFGYVPSNPNLVREKTIDFEADALKRKEEAKVRKDQEKIHRKNARISDLRKDPKLTKSFAEYYKLSKFMASKKVSSTGPAEIHNRTSHNLEVKRILPIPPKNLSDLLNEKAGQYINHTDNAFEQQLYTNQAKPVHQQNGESRIIMSNLDEYKTDLEEVFPLDREQWLDSDGKKTANQRGAVPKGLRRWRELPQAADFASERGLNAPVYDTDIDTLKMLGDNDVTMQPVMISNQSLIQVVEQWRSEWKLGSGWQDITLAEVLLQLESLHDDRRLAAVSACAIAALHRKPVSDSVAVVVATASESSRPTAGDELFSLAEELESGHLDESLRDSIQRCLHDSCCRVRLAATFCLFAIGGDNLNEELVKILEENLENGTRADRIASAQCLALADRTDAKVIDLLIRLLLETSDEKQREQATNLLVHISKNTRLVHSFLAEKLNSSNWREKVLSCNVLSRLSGQINRDLVHKLTNLMWNDWSHQVRQGAAAALGRTGHGRDVHYQLREKLVANGNTERTRVNVLKMMGDLGLMTATLLPEFIKALQAEYVSIRLQACQTAGRLRLTNERVVKEIIRMARYDPAWKIKAHAIKALGEAQLEMREIYDAILWALRFEDEAAVRLEACAAIRKLNYSSDDVISVLQDRVLVEPDPFVKLEVRRTMQAFGLTGPEDNMEMIKQIKSEVKKLCKKSVVAAKVILYEKELQKFQNEAHYLGTSLTADNEIQATS